MRVVFMGTPEIAVPPLKKILLRSHEVCAVVTQPDRPSGRGHSRKPSSVKTFALEKGLTILQPEKIRDDEYVGVIERLQPDFIIVAAYGQLLPLSILRTAGLAPLNIHFSLLPRYRGAAPVAKAILNGDDVTGVTIMIMQESLDSGPVLGQRSLQIPPYATTGEMEEKLSEIGGELLVETMDACMENNVTPLYQDDGKASWAPRITKDDARIDWSENAGKIHNRIRAMNPRPGAFTYFGGKMLHIWSSFPEAERGKGAHAPGTFLGITEHCLRIQCAEGSVLQIRELQKPSKNRVSGREFANGARLLAGSRIFERNESL